MKIYISADIEGITGVTSWNETNKAHADYAEFQQQMTREVAAACLGCLDAGAEEITVKDAHDSGRNILAGQLPPKTRLIRGWSGHPLGMVQDLNDSFDAVMMIGYHSRAFSNRNPLAHTWSSSRIAWMKLNGEWLSEFAMHMLAAETIGVPVVLVTGDQGLVEEVEQWNSHIMTVAVKEGRGDSTINIHPDLAVQLIQRAAHDALKVPRENFHVSLPESFRLELCFKHHQQAYRASHYPGAIVVDDHTVAFSNSDYHEILRFRFFAL